MFIALTAVSMNFSVCAAQAQDMDLRCWTQRLMGYLHSCPLVVSEATSEQIGLLGKFRDTLTRLGRTIDAEQLSGRLLAPEANEMRTELDMISTNMEDAVRDGTLSYDEGAFIVRRLSELDNRTDMLVASHPAMRIAFDTDIDIRLRDLSGRVAQDLSSGLLTAAEADELRRTLDVIGEENANIKADRRITPAEQERMRIALDTLGKRLDDLSTNQWVAVRTLFTWSDFEPRQRELYNRLQTSVDQGLIPPARATAIRAEIENLNKLAASIHAERNGGIVATPSLVVLRQRQNMIDHRITQEIRLAAGRPAGM